MNTVVENMKRPLCGPKIKGGAKGYRPTIIHLENAKWLSARLEKWAKSRQEEPG
jgi:hypothetical protein